MKKKTLFVMFLGLMTCLVKAHADVDPNFHIYLCFGQSNMEGSMPKGAYIVNGKLTVKSNF